MRRPHAGPRRGTRKRSPRPARWGPGLAGAVLALLLAAVPLLANGGTLRIADQPVGGYQVSVYTAPTPPRPDSLDVSVLVVRPGETGTVEGLSIVVHATPEEGPGGPRGGHPWVVAATREQATDPRYYAAVIPPGVPGRWHVRVEVTGPEGEGEVGFTVDVREPGPLQNPWVITVLALVPLAALAWWLLRGTEEEEDGEEA